MLKFEKKIKIYRNKIDLIDVKLIKLLKSRFLICADIGKLKKQTNQPINQPQRHQELIDKRLCLANHYNLNPLFIKHIFELITEESRDIQKTPRTH